MVGHVWDVLSPQTQLTRSVQSLTSEKTALEADKVLPTLGAFLWASCIAVVVADHIRDVLLAQNQLTRSMHILASNITALEAGKVFQCYCTHISMLFLNAAGYKIEPSTD